MDPDGRENFNFENFFKCQIEAFFLDIYSSGLEMLGCVENFFTNVENGNYEVDAGVALI